MTKQELIKEAYGEYWEQLKPFIDCEGWMHRIDFPTKHNIDIEEHSNQYHIRPKSLQGIETNNGWKRIEGQHNLPDIDTDYWCVYKGEVTKRSFNHHLPRSVEFWTDNITHYQPIVKPEPPLY